MSIKVKKKNVPYVLKRNKHVKTTTKSEKLHPMNMVAPSFERSEASPLGSRKNASRKDGHGDGFPPTSCSPPTSRPLSVGALAHLLTVSLARSRSSMPSASLSLSASPSSTSYRHPPNAFWRWHHWWWTWAAVSPVVRVVLEMQEPHGVVLLWGEGCGGEENRVGTRPEEVSSSSAGVPSIPTASDGSRNAVLPWGVQVTITRYRTERRVEEEEEEEEENSKSMPWTPSWSTVPTLPEQKCGTEERRVQKASTQEASTAEQDGRVTAPEGTLDHTAPRMPLRWGSSRHRWWTDAALPKEKWKSKVPLAETTPPVLLPHPTSCSATASSSLANVLQVEVALLSEEDARPMWAPTTVPPLPTSSASLASSGREKSVPSVAYTMARALQRCSWWIRREVGSSTTASTVLFSPCTRLALSLRGHLLPRRAIDGQTARERRRKRREMQEAPPAARAHPSRTPPTRPTDVVPLPPTRPHEPSPMAMASPDASPLPYHLPSRLPVFSLALLESLASLAILSPTPQSFSRSPCVACHEMDSRGGEGGGGGCPTAPEDGWCQHCHSPWNRVAPPPPAEADDALPTPSGPPLPSHPACGSFPFYLVDTLLLSYWSFSVQAWRYLPVLFAASSRGKDPPPPPSTPTAHPPWPLSTVSCGRDGDGIHRLYVAHCGVHGMDTRLARTVLFPPSSSPPPPSWWFAASATCPALLRLWQSSSAGVERTRLPLVLSFAPTTAATAAVVGSDASWTSIPTSAGKAGDVGMGDERHSPPQGIEAKESEREGRDASGKTLASPTAALPVSSSPLRSPLDSPGEWLNQGVWFPALQEVCCLSSGGEAFWMGIEAFLTPPVSSPVPPPPPTPPTTTAMTALHSLSLGSASESPTEVFPFSSGGPPLPPSSPPPPSPLRVLAMQEHCDISPKRFSLLLTSIAMRNRSSSPFRRRVPCPSASAVRTFSSLYEVQVEHSKLLGGVLLERFCQFPFVCRQLKAFILPNGGVTSPAPFVAWLHTLDASPSVASPSAALPISHPIQENPEPHCSETGEPQEPHLEEEEHVPEAEEKEDVPLPPPPALASPSPRSLPRHYFHYWNLRWNAGANDELYRACEELGIRVGELWIGGSSGSSGQIYRIADHVSP